MHACMRVYCICVRACVRALPEFVCIFLTFACCCLWGVLGCGWRCGAFAVLLMVCKLLIAYFESDGKCKPSIAIQVNAHSSRTRPTPNSRCSPDAQEEHRPDERWAARVRAAALPRSQLLGRHYPHSHGKPTDATQPLPFHPHPHIFLCFKPPYCIISFSPHAHLVGL